MMLGCLLLDCATHCFLRPGSSCDDSLASDNCIDALEQLVQVKVVFSGDIRQGVKGLYRTTNAQQAEIHEQLQKLWITVQQFLDGNVR